MIYNYIFLVSWIVFLVYWGVTAIGSKKNIQQPGLLGSNVLFRVVFLLAVILILSRPGPAMWLHQHQYLMLKPIAKPIGALCCVVGITLAIWSRKILGKNWGMPMSLKEEPELVTVGPYNYIRHPIYTGVLLAILGSALAVGIVWFIVFIGGIIYFTWSALQEQKNMLRLFPEQYPVYKQRTKMFIPFVV